MTGYKVARYGFVLLDQPLWDDATVTVDYVHGFPQGHPALEVAAGVTLSAAARLVDNPTGLRSTQWSMGPESEMQVYAGNPAASALLSAAERNDLAPFALALV